MEELNINEVHDLMNNMHRDELINDNEDYEDNNIEYVDEVQNNQLVV